MSSFSQFADAFGQDLKYALRGLRKSRGFAAAVIVALAFGIGANAAMFGVVDRLMFRPYPYLKDPSRVHRIYVRLSVRGTTRTQAGEFPYTRYTDIRDGTSSFTHHAAFLSPSLAVGVGDAARERRVGVVSAAFWDFFAARPALGRFFTAAEDTTPRGADVVVLGHGFWKAELGGRTDVVGQAIHVNNVSATIIGVAPEGFVGVDDGDPPVLFMPISTYRGAADAASKDPTSWFRTYDRGWVSIMVRRKPAVSVEQSAADVTRALRASYLREMELSPGMTPVDKSNPTGIVSAMKIGAGPDPSLEARTALWVTGVAAIVLLIACANVANLFLSRALRRQREIAIRLALGVRRWRLVMQTLIESLVLSLLGSFAGLLVAYWGGAGIRRLLVASDNAPLEVFTDWRTIGVAIGAALLAAVLIGIAPSLVSVPGDLASTLKTGARGGGGSYQRSRVRTVLLVLQGALSVVLLVGAVLFVKSLDNVKTMRLGYDAERVLLVNRSMRGTRLDSATSVALRNALVDKARTIPGVDAASWMYSVPFRSTSATRLFVAGIDTVARLGRFTYQASSPEYFRTMGTRIVRGRAYTDADRAGAPRVMVVSESMGRVLWPNADPLGQCVKVHADTMPCTTVIGIAEDMIQNDLQTTTRFHYYMPIEQFDPAGGNGLFLRLRGDPRQHQEAVRKALQTVMPGETFVIVTPLIDVVDAARRSWQLGATMFGAFGVLALIVAAIGLYGVIGYNVTQRMHELGVRVALGAQSTDILRLVVGQGMAFAFAGVVLGALIGFAASRWLQPLLFQQSAKDPVVYAFVGVIMLVVALGASASPAARAAKADPNAALRAE